MNYYLTFNSDPNVLAHHGILGQKWGKRNGPPYPLSEEDHSSAEKKAQWKRSIRGDNQLTDKRQELKAARKAANKAYDRVQNHAIMAFSPVKSHREKYNAMWDDYVSKQSAYDKAKAEYKTQKKAAKATSSGSLLRDDHDREIQGPGFSSHLTPEEKKKYTEIAIGTAAAVGVGVGIFFAYKYHATDKIARLSAQGQISRDAAKKVMLDTLADGDQIFKKGDVLHRMTAFAGVDDSLVSKPMYTSFRDKDVATYMTMLKDWHGTGKRYDVTYQALQDLKVPSRQRAQKIFEDLWNSDASYRDQLKKTVAEAYQKLYEKRGFPAQKAKQLGLQQAASDLRSDPFMTAMYSIVKNKDDTRAYIKQLQKSGYDAIIDYFDQGAMAKEPLIILDPKGKVQKIGENLVTKQVKLDTLTALKSAGETTLATGDSIDSIMRYIRIGML